MKQDDAPKPASDSHDQEIPGGAAATPTTPEGRNAALEEGEEA